VLSEHCDLPIPEGLVDLDKKEVRHKALCGREGMKAEVRKILGI
jgi:hypothetical protein